MLQIRLITNGEFIKGEKYLLIDKDNNYYIAEWFGRVFDDNFQVYDEPCVFKEIYLIESKS